MGNNRCVHSGQALRALALFARALGNIMARPILPPAEALHALASSEGSLAVRVTPNARTEAISIEDGQIKIRVTVVPEDGKANKAVLALLAKALGVSKSSLTILKGETARDKIIGIHG